MTLSSLFCLTLFNSCPSQTSTCNLCPSHNKFRIPPDFMEISGRSAFWIMLVFPETPFFPTTFLIKNFFFINTIRVDEFTVCFTTISNEQDLQLLHAIIDVYTYFLSQQSGNILKAGLLYFYVLSPARSWSKSRHEIFVE